MYNDEDNDYCEYDDAYNHYMHTGELSEWFEDNQEEEYELDERIDEDTDSFEQQTEENKRTARIHRNIQSEEYRQPQRQIIRNSKEPGNNRGCLGSSLWIITSFSLIIIALYIFP